MAGFERTESPLGKMLSNSITCYGELVRKGKSHLLQQTSRFYFKKVLPPPPWSVSSQQHRGKTVHRLSGHDSLKAQGMVSIFSHRIFKLRYAHFFRCNSFTLLIDYGYVEMWLLCFGKPRTFIWLYCDSHFVVVWSWAFYVWGMPEEEWSDSGQFQQKRTLVARIIITNSKGLNLEMRPEEEMKEQNPPPSPNLSVETLLLLDPGRQNYTAGPQGRTRVSSLPWKHAAEATITTTNYLDSLLFRFLIQGLVSASNGQF